MPGQGWGMITCRRAVPAGGSVRAGGKGSAGGVREQVRTPTWKVRVQWRRPEALAMSNGGGAPVGEVPRREVLNLTEGKERGEGGSPARKPSTRCSPPGPALGRPRTWQRGVHDREHQSPGAEGLPAHVGKDRNAEAAQDETGVEHAAQGLGVQRAGDTHLGGVTQLPLRSGIGFGPSTHLLLP